MGPSKPANKAEKARMDKLSKMLCPFCKQIGMAFDTPTEIHHLLSGNKRMGHWYTIPSCGGHHRGAWTVSQKQKMHPSELVSIADGRRLFISVYGLEKSTWLDIQQANGWDDEWPTSKIVRRKEAA